MDSIKIKKARPGDSAVIERILLDTVGWLREINQPLWRAEDVGWEALSKHYRLEDFRIAYFDGEPAGCMVLVDYDPFFWPDTAKGEALMIHKLAVVKRARKTGVAAALLDYAKSEGMERGAFSIRLDCHSFRDRLRAFYERHGFACAGEKTFGGKWYTAFYVYDFKERGDLYLEIPRKSHECEYEAMMDEWEAFGGRLNPGALRRYSHAKKRALTFEEWFERIQEDKKGDLNDKVPQHLYFFMLRGRILGAVTIRTRLTDELLERGGNIAYGIRPGERRKGYGTRMLALALPIAHRLTGAGRILATCDKDNIGSARVIQNNGGTLENEIQSGRTGNTEQRYWIEV